MNKIDDPKGPRGFSIGQDATRNLIWYNHEGPAKSQLCEQFGEEEIWDFENKWQEQFDRYDEMFCHIHDRVLEYEPEPNGWLRFLAQGLNP